MHVPPNHLPIIFLASCAISTFLGIGILSWGFTPMLIVYVGYGVAMLYLIALTIIQKPWRGRRERIAARRPRWQTSSDVFSRSK